MKKIYHLKLSKFVLMFFCGISCSLNYSFASDGVIHFTGGLTTGTCIVDPNDRTQTVNLGDIPSTYFDASGDKSPAISFDIDLSNCPDSVNSVLAKFDGLSDPTNTNLLSLDSGASATSVGIEIDETDGTPIPLHTASRATTIDQVTHAAKLPFEARYVSTSTEVGAGTATATSQFSLNYN